MKKIYSNGFTMIELMITIAIVGILASIAIPIYKDYINRSKVSEGVSLASQAQIAVTEYYQENNKFPESNSQANLVDATKIVGKYVASVSVNENGVITVTYKNSDNGGVGDQDLKLYMQPTSNDGSISWIIGSTGDDGVPAKWCASSFSANCLGSGS